MNPETNIELNMERAIMTESGLIEGVVNENVYIHSAAVDSSGRISCTTHFFFAIDPTASFTFTEYPVFIFFPTTFAHSNERNKFRKSNTMVAEEPDDFTNVKLSNVGILLTVHIFSQLI